MLSSTKGPSYIISTLEEQQHRHVWGNTPISGHVDSTLASTVLQKKKIRHSITNYETQNKGKTTHCQKRCAAPDISVGTPRDPECSGRGRRTRAQHNFLQRRQLGLHGGCASDTATSSSRLPLPQIHDAPSQVLPEKLVLIYAPVIMGAQHFFKCLMAFGVFLISSEYPVIFLLIASLFLVDVQESPLNPKSAFAVKKGKRTCQAVTRWCPWCPSLNRSPSSGSGQTHQSFALSPTHVGSSKVVLTPSNKGKLHIISCHPIRPLSLPTSLHCSYQSHQVPPATASPGNAAFLASLARFSRAFPPAPGCSLAQPSGLQTRGYTNTTRA